MSDLALSLSFFFTESVAAVVLVVDDRSCYYCNWYNIALRMQIANFLLDDNNDVADIDCVCSFAIQHYCCCF